MVDESVVDFASEAYQVVEALEVEAMLNGEPRRFRIEAHRVLKCQAKIGPYVTVAYTEEVVSMQPAYPMVRDEYESEPRDMTVWVRYDRLPDTNEKSAEDAMRRALGWLSRAPQE